MVDLVPALYVALSVMVGLCAIGRRPGFLLAFTLSLLLTPVLMLIALYVTRPRVD